MFRRRTHRIPCRGASLIKPPRTAHDPHPKQTGHRTPTGPLGHIAHRQEAPPRGSRHSKKTHIARRSRKRPKSPDPSNFRFPYDVFKLKSPRPRGFHVLPWSGVSHLGVGEQVPHPTPSRRGCRRGDVAPGRVRSVHERLCSLLPGPTPGVVETGGGAGTPWGLWYRVVDEVVYGPNPLSATWIDWARDPRWDSSKSLQDHGGSPRAAGPQEVPVGS